MREVWILYKFESDTYYPALERRVIIGVYDSKEKAQNVARNLEFRSWEFTIKEYEVI